MIKCFNFDYDGLEFSSNTYVVGEKEGPCVIIDLGSTNKKIINYIRENHSEVKAILLTHGHFDHIRGINSFLNVFKDCPVYVDANDYELLINEKLNCSSISGENVTVKSENIKTFKDHDLLEFDETNIYEVFETPFHTDGSVCLLNKKENALFTGDTLFKGSIGRYDLITSNRNYLSNSLQIVKKFDKELVVYPGHGEKTTMKHELINNYYLK